MRHPTSVPSKKRIVHTLVVIGLIGSKTVYLDVPPRKAIKRYIEENGDDPRTRHQVEATEVFKINDEFRVHDLWIGNPTKSHGE